MTVAPNRPGWLRRFAADIRGAAAAEMALVFPMIGLLMLNIVDFTFYTYNKMQVDLAAEQAVGVVRALCVTPSATNCSTTFAADMTTAAQETTLGNRVSLVSGSLLERYYCADTNGTLQPVDALQTTCASVVSGSVSKPGRYLAATVTFTHTPIFPGVTVVAFLTSPIQSTAWMRLQ